MSVVQPAPIDRGASPLMSNNPFRNRVASASPTDSQPRPISTNPFLDVTEADKTDSNAKQTTKSSEKATVQTTELFDKLEINGLAKSPQRAPPRPPNAGLRRPENNPPRSEQRPSTSHRTPASEEDKRRQMKQRAELDIFADPPDAAKLRERRPRRNSESSVRDKPNGTLDPEEEKKRRERKQRESKRIGSSSKSKPNRRIDVIDKLDVTSIYGTGLFHHDGPFDACNPHRNRRREKFAPMQAFPKDSINMIVGGSGPVNPKLDYNRFHGYGEEAHRDYNEAALADNDNNDGPRRPPVGRHGSYNPGAREYIHGDETVGLGTSTFLEGAPASRAAIQRRESEYESAQLGKEGAPALSRKKSLAQKIRGVRTTRDKVTSPGASTPPQSPLGTGTSERVTTGYFDGFDKEKDKEAEKKDSTTEQEEETTTRPRAPSSPSRNPLERRNTTDAAPEEQVKSSSGGFLGRMKSLKSGGKPRPARRDTSS